MCLWKKKRLGEIFRKWNLSKKSYFQIYGKENFYKIIIDECDSEEELREVEEYYIEQFDAVKSREFYNVKATSIGGDTFTNNPNKEHIRKLKSINSSGCRNPMYGRPKTQKTIESIKKANSRPISIDGVEYPSTNEASRILGIGNTTIHYRMDSKNFPNYVRLYTKRQTTIETEHTLWE